MRILILVDKSEERKNLEHLLISKGFDSFHSAHPNDDWGLYIEKIDYNFVIIISDIIYQNDVLNLSTKFSKGTIIISVSNDLKASKNIVSIPFLNNYKEKLIEYLKSKTLRDKPLKEDILIKINDKYKRIRLDAIEFIKADGKYIALHSDKRKYSLRNTLKGISLMLPNNFIRTHSSYIVNLNKIESIHMVEQSIELQNSSIPFSRKYKLNLLDRFHLG